MSIIYKMKRKLSKDKGIVFEKLVTKKLKKYFKRSKALIFEDLLLVDETKRKTQIDNLVFTSKYVFVIECKKKYGQITRLDERTLKQTLNSVTSHNFLDPYLQNETHMFFVRKLMRTTHTYVNIIIYSDDAKLLINDKFSINLKDLNSYLDKFEFRKVRNKKEIKRKIKYYNKNSFLNRFKHKKYIKGKSKK